MARKKVSPATALATEAVEKKEVLSHPPPPSGRDLLPDKMESLKTLNNLLIKETVERRQQVDHLQCRLDGLANDHAFLARVERDVSRLVLSSVLAERQLAAGRVETDLRSLQARVDSTAEELRSGGERLEMVVGERDEVKKALDRALLEKDLNSMHLDQKEKEVRGLEAKVRELEIGIAEIGANVGKLETERNELVEQGKKREELIHSLLQEKASMEASLDEYKQLVESGERRMEEVIKIKQEEAESVKAKREAIAAKVTSLEAEHRSLVENNQSLESEVGCLKAVIFLLKKEEEGLRNEIAEMEKGIAKVTEELLSEIVKKEALVAWVSNLEPDLQSLSENNHRLEAEVNCSKSAFELLKKEEKGLLSEVAEMEKKHEKVTEELERLQAELGALENEKEEIFLYYEERVMSSEKELDTSRTWMREIEREKVAIEGVRAAQETEINNLQKELQQLRSTIYKLQVMCNDHTDTNFQLQAERDSAWRDLDLQKVEEDCLRVQTEELKKRNNEAAEEMQQVQRALNDFALKEEGWKVQSDVLKEENTSFEKKLMTAQQSLEGMERKIEAADMSSKRVLSLLKNTTEMMHGSVEVREVGVARDIGSEEEKDEEMQPFVKELETIKMAYKSWVGKIEDMNRELVVLQHVVTKTQKAGLWKWLYPAITTVFAAISFAYAVRGR
ncbi:rootletin-like [Phoenix dactylifera]|uniref:Rootletin-like n=1 Tax=Phoenix dactylifera TaxID=42345 RepID=A0A8B7CVY5_PHODC|nr:rootletin-like [Phoenix dactylifera]